jgi:hypothetical protein
MTTPKRALTYTVTRHYAPDLARQAQALLRLLAPTGPQTTLASGAPSPEANTTNDAAERNQATAIATTSPRRKRRHHGAL